MEELSFEDIGTHVQAMDLDLRHNFKDRGKLFRARVVACFNALPPPAGPADSDERLPLWFTVVDRQRRSEDELRRDLTSLLRVFTIASVKGSSAASTSSPVPSASTPSSASSSLSQISRQDEKGNLSSSSPLKEENQEENQFPAESYTAVESNGISGVEPAVTWKRFTNISDIWEMTPTSAIVWYLPIKTSIGVGLALLMVPFPRGHAASVCLGIANLGTGVHTRPDACYGTYMEYHEVVGALKSHQLPWADLPDPESTPIELGESLMLGAVFDPESSAKEYKARIQQCFGPEDFESLRREVKEGVLNAVRSSEPAVIAVGILDSSAELDGNTGPSRVVGFRLGMEKDAWLAQARKALAEKWFSKIFPLIAKSDLVVTLHTVDMSEVFSENKVNLITLSRDKVESYLARINGKALIIDAPNEDPEKFLSLLIPDYEGKDDFHNYDQARYVLKIVVKGSNHCHAYHISRHQHRSFIAVRKTEDDETCLKALSDTALWLRLQPIPVELVREMRLPGSLVAVIPKMGNESLTFLGTKKLVPAVDLINRSASIYAGRYLLIRSTKPSPEVAWERVSHQLRKLVKEADDANSIEDDSPSLFHGLQIYIVMPCYHSSADKLACYVSKLGLRVHGILPLDMPSPSLQDDEHEAKLESFGILAREFSAPAVSLVSQEWSDGNLSSSDGQPKDDVQIAMNWHHREHRPCQWSEIAYLLGYGFVARRPQS